MSTQSWFSKHYLVVALFGVSLLFHVYYGWTHFVFAQDQARDWLLMEEYRVNNVWVVGYGPSTSAGDFSLPPFYYQLHNIVSHLTGNNEYAMMWVIVLVESFTAVVLFYILRFIVSDRLALAASVLYIFSPLAITLATSIWNPNMIPFFSSLALLSWLFYIMSKKSWWIPIGCLSSALILHLHFQAIFLFLFIGILFAWSLVRRLHDWKYWLLGILLALVTFLPYFWAEAQNDWQNTLNLYEFIFVENAQIYDRVTKPEYVLSFLPGFMERLLIGGNTTYLVVGRLIFWIGMAALAFFAFLKRGAYMWLLIYISSILLMLRIYKGDKLDYYMSVLFIVPFILWSVVGKFLVENDYWSRISSGKSLARLQKILWVLLVGFTFLIGVLAGRNASQIKAFNELNELLDATRYLERFDEGRGFLLYYHYKDYSTPLTYSFNKVGILENYESSLWVDVCVAKEPCAWDGALICEHTQEYTDAVELKMSSNYEIIDLNTFGRYQIVVGKID